MKWHRLARVQPIFVRELYTSSTATNNEGSFTVVVEATNL
jgi:hypothetical protein